MRGRYHNAEDKWMRINQIMRDRKIGILALQETHLSPNEVDDLHKIFEKRLQIYATIDPANSQSKGVAIVVNKEISNIVGIKTNELIPGRALHLTIPWHGDSKRTVLAAYSPNDAAENARFLELLEFKTRNLPKPDFVLGDFNMVEDLIDRLPHHKDPTAVVDAMRNLKARLHLHDGWRHTYPDIKAYTFLQSATGSQSRIDRILVTSDILKNCSDWTIESPGIHTDHQLVSVRYSDPKMPFIGKGRWVLSLRLLRDEKVMEQVYAVGKEMETRMENVKNKRTFEENPQTIFKNFKDEITTIFRDRDKVLVPKLDKEIRGMKSDLKNMLNNPLMRDEERKTESAALQ
ncbi:Endonuclease/exonuclease/phosphatase, partial [Mycena maculata]